MYGLNEDTKDIVNEFTCIVINDVQSYFNCSFDKVDFIFKRLGYWDILNNDELACVEASEYIKEEFLKRIKEMRLF